VSLLKADGTKETDYVVDINTKTCDCRRWQLSGIPCNHAIACFREDNINPESMVHNCYTIAAYYEAYGYKISPMRDRAHWQKMDATFVHPPTYTKVMGRPKRCRKKTPEEKEKNGAKKLSKHGVTMHCSICKFADHNKKGHHNHMNSPSQQATDPEEEIDDPRILEVCLNPSPLPLVISCLFSINFAS